MQSDRRWDYQKKRLVEDAVKLTTTPLHQYMTALNRGEPTKTHGVLDWWRGDERIASMTFHMLARAEGSREHSDILVHLSYRYLGHDGQKVRRSTIVPVCSTTPTFGGRRWWWRCPAQTRGKPCDRRVGVLYLPSAQSYAACRTCHNLTYFSAQHSHTRFAAALRLTPEEREARMDDAEVLDPTELRMLLRASYLHDERAQPMQIRVR